MNTQPAPLTEQERNMLHALLLRAYAEARRELPRNIADRFEVAAQAVARLGGGK